MDIQGKMAIPSSNMKIQKLQKWVFDDPFSLTVDCNGRDEYFSLMTMNSNVGDDSL